MRLALKSLPVLRKMHLTVECPGCGQRFCVAVEFAGRTARCSNCKQPVGIPSVPTATAEVPILAMPAPVNSSDGAITEAEIAAAVTAEPVGSNCATQNGDAANANVIALVPKVSRFRSLVGFLSSTIQNGWTLTTRVARYYVGQREAIRRRFVEYTVDAEKSPEREREIILSAAEHYETAHGIEPCWRIQLPDCCVVCGDAADDDWEVRIRTVPEVTKALWLPVVGVFLAVLLGWHWSSPLAFLAIWGASFFAGYAVRRDVRVELKLRRCRKHAAFTSTPKLFMLGGRLALRVGHISVREAFSRANRGKQESERPESDSRWRQYTPDRLRDLASAPPVSDSSDAASKRRVERWCASCGKPIPRVSSDCQACLSKLLETRRTILAALKEYESNLPRDPTSIGKSGGTFTRVANWTLTAGVFLVNPAAGLATAAKVRSDENQEKKGRQSGGASGADRGRSDIVALRDRGYPVQSAVDMKQLLGPILNAEATALRKLATGESPVLARGALLGLVDSGLGVRVAFEVVEMVLRSSADSSVRTLAVELLGTLGIDRESARPVYSLAARDGHEPIATLASSCLASWGTQVPAPGPNTSSQSAERDIAEDVEFNRPIPLAEAPNAVAVDRSLESAIPEARPAPNDAPSLGAQIAALCDICMQRSNFTRELVRGDMGSANNQLRYAGWRLIDQAAFQANVKLVDLAICRAHKTLTGVAEPAPPTAAMRLEFIQATLRASADPRWLVCPTCIAATGAFEEVPGKSSITLGSDE